MLSLKISVISMMKKTQTMLNTIDKQDSKQWYKYDIIINRVFNKKYDSLFVCNINNYSNDQSIHRDQGLIPFGWSTHS